MSSLASLFLILCTVLLSGCVTMADVPEWEELAFWKEKKVIVVTAQEIKENWCYRTLAAVDCYTKPQNMSPERLVGVYPPHRKPLTRDEHAQALLDAAQKKP